MEFVGLDQIFVAPTKIHDPINTDRAGQNEVVVFFLHNEYCNTRLSRGEADKISNRMTKTKILGTLLPMTALVSKSVLPGTFQAGHKFVDWLVKSKQSAWQLLPLHENQLERGSTTKHVPSPYKGYGIGLDPRYLSDNDPLLSEDELQNFIQDNQYWVKEYVLFCSLRDHFGTDNWSEWPDDIRQRNIAALIKWRKKLVPEMDNHLRTQAQLHLAYERLHEKARENSVLLSGDMPFYLSMNSPLVWQYQYLFDIESSGQLMSVSGVLQGQRSHFGRQVWGHPLYLWQDKDSLEGIYRLFEIRLKYLARFYDLIRLDYANGLFVNGVIDLSDNRLDRYQNGPGRPFLEKLIKSARKLKLRIYAEDTGINLKELRNCLHRHRVAGIKIFRFAYNEKRKLFVDMYLKVSQYPVNTVAYTTTHDTEPLMGYLENLSDLEISNLAMKLRLNKSLPVTDLAKAIRTKVVESPAKIVIIPLQDWLLTTDRINIPGTEQEIGDTNWQYKMNVVIEGLPVDIIE